MRFNKIAFWDIRYFQLLGFLISYFLLGFSYWLIIQLTANFKGQDGLSTQIIINYSLKAVVTLPVYWLLFYKLKHWTLPQRLLLHILACPAFLIIWLWGYHRVSDWFGEYYLKGRYLWWDVYIPFLFYIMQFGTFHLYDYYMRYEEQLKLQHTLELMARRSEISALKAQLQPHFLFNTLNSISASVPQNMERTRELIAQLADTFRFALQSSLRDWIQVKEEAEFIDTYLQLEQQRFADKLTYKIQIDENVPSNLNIPPMLLQPLVENAVKHGAEPSLWPVEVSIRINTSEDVLVCSVSDTGIGMDGHNTDKLLLRGVGLKNTKERIEKQFGETIIVQPNFPSGFIVSFKLPLSQLYYV